MTKKAENSNTPLQPSLDIADVSNSHCLVVTCLPCKTPFRWKEAPEGCCECGMLDWLCFNTEQEANEAFKKQYPEQFDGDGKYIGTQHR